MAKLVIIHDNGNEEYLGIVPDKTTVRDIVLRDDFIATKLWSREDVKQVLREEGSADTEENVDEVISYGYLKALNEKTNNDWEIIRNAIDWTLALPFS